MILERRQLLLHPESRLVNVKQSSFNVEQEAGFRSASPVLQKPFLLDPIQVLRLMVSGRVPSVHIRTNSDKATDHANPFWQAAIAALQQIVLAWSLDLRLWQRRRTASRQRLCAESAPIAEVRCQGSNIGSLFKLTADLRAASFEAAWFRKTGKTKFASDVIGRK